MLLGRRLARRAQPETRAHHGFVRFGMAVRLVSAERVGQHALAPQLRRSASVSSTTKLLCMLGAHVLLPDQVEQRTERRAHLGSLAAVTSCRPVGRPHYRLAGGMLFRAKAVRLLQSPSRGHVDYGWRYEVL